MNKGFWKSGDPFVWLTGSALAFALLMIVSLLVIIFANAISFFWPGQLVHVKLQSGEELLGQIVAHEDIPGSRVENARLQARTEFQVANRDLYGADFRWVEGEILSQDTPANAVYFERWEWGALFGFLKELRLDGQLLPKVRTVWQSFQELHPQTQKTLEKIHAIEKKEIGAINYQLERLRLAKKPLLAHPLTRNNHSV
jgi:phosphate transport system permease protein